MNQAACSPGRYGGRARDKDRRANRFQESFGLPTAANIRLATQKCYRSRHLVTITDRWDQTLPAVPPEPIRDEGTIANGPVGPGGKLKIFQPRRGGLHGAAQSLSRQPPGS